MRSACFSGFLRTSSRDECFHSFILQVTSTVQPPSVPAAATHRWWYARLKLQYATRGLQVGDAYYIVNAKWLQKWQQSVGYSSEFEARVAEFLAAAGTGADLTVPPAFQDAPEVCEVLEPVDNSMFVRVGGASDVSGCDSLGAAGASGPALRTGLVPGHDYHMIGEEIWKMLTTLHSGGPAIRRIVQRVGDTDDVRVALFPDIPADTPVVDEPPAAAAVHTVSARFDDDSDDDSIPAAARTVAYVGLHPLPVSAASPEACFVCGRAGSRKKCSRCKKAKYCGELCQRVHWTWHKLECGAPEGTVVSRFGLVGLKVRPLCACVCLHRTQLSAHTFACLLPSHTSTISPAHG
jgi:hypothetical protein